MSDAHFAVPMPVAFPSTQADTLLGAGREMPLRPPHANEQIALGGPPPVTEAPPLVREVIEGKPMHRTDPVVAAAPMLRPGFMEADLDALLARLVHEVGLSIRFDPAESVPDNMTNMQKAMNVVEALNDVRICLAPAIAVLPR